VDKITYIALRQSRAFVGVKLVFAMIFLFLFWWLRRAVIGWLGRFMPVDLMATVTGMSILLWVSLLVYGGLVLQILAQWYTTVYEVFTDRIVLKTGLISKSSRAVSLGDFSQFQQYQGILGRLLRYGTIEFMYRTIGPTGGFGETFYNIENPDLVAAQLKSLMQLKDETGGVAQVKPVVDTTEAVLHQEDARTVTAAVMEASGEVAAQLRQATGVEAIATSDENDEDTDSVSGEIQF